MKRWKKGILWMLPVMLLIGGAAGWAALKAEMVSPAVIAALLSLLFVGLGTALAADRETPAKGQGEKSYPVGTNVVIYKGSLVCINAAGYAAPAAQSASFRVVGVAAENGNNNPGANGAISVRVVSGRHFRFAASSITQAMVGQIMYVVDDQTVDDAIGAQAVKAGILTEFLSVTEGWIFIPDGGIGEGAVLADAGATYTSAEQNLINQLKARLNTYLHVWALLLLGGGLLAVMLGWLFGAVSTSTLALVLSGLAIGGVVDTDTLAAIRTDFQALFLESYQGLKTRWQDVATEFPATTQLLDLSWLGEVPAMKEWVDERVLEGLRRFRYAIENRDWEATIEVDRNAIEDDTLGVYRPRIQGLAQEAKRHLDELVSILLETGDATAAFDGLNFFADTRVVGGSGNIDNIVTGTGSTQAQFQADYISAKTAMAGYTNDRGKPFNPDMSRLVVAVPPALEFVAKQTFNATIISNTGNILVGEADVWSNAYLGDLAAQANDWYLLNVSGPIKPFAVSMRRRPSLNALDDPRSEMVFLRRKFLYGADGRYNTGVLLPWLAVKVNNA